MEEIERGGSGQWLEELELKDCNRSENKTITTVRLPFSQYNRVSDISDATGLSQSEVLRRLISSGMEEVKKGD